MENRKVYIRPSAHPLLQAAPTQVATLLARYLNLLEGFAQKHGVTISRTEVAGHRDSEDGSQQLAISHRVRISPVDALGYRSHLGTEIEGWVRGLTDKEVDLVQDWFILEVTTEPEGE